MKSKKKLYLEWIDQSEGVGIDENQAGGVDSNEGVGIDQNEGVGIDQNQAGGIDQNEGVGIDQNQFDRIDQNQFGRVDQNQFGSVDQNLAEGVNPFDGTNLDKGEGGEGVEGVQIGDGVEGDEGVQAEEDDVIVDEYNIHPEVEVDMKGVNLNTDLNFGIHNVTVDMEDFESNTDESDLGNDRKEKSIEEVEKRECLS